MAYTAWYFSDEQRQFLLGLVPPVYPDLIAHHVTQHFGVPPDTSFTRPALGTVVGVADDGTGVQALVLTMNSALHRPDGKIYHCTWSIDRSRGRRPVDSNQIVLTTLWTIVNSCPAFLMRAAVFD